MLSLAVIIFALASLCFLNGTPIVKTKYSKIIGSYKTSNAGNKYEAFEGIPYALPPVGKRRFESPQPIKKWPPQILANEFKDECVSHTRDVIPTGYLITGVEDCLYLNVYVPSNRSSNSLPVIFWIYGGAFQYSTLDSVAPRNLIDHDIIFVSVNYRHGSLGFLSTEDNVVSGNMGLKDQAFALKWVSENIKYFGGDPNKVTLTGLSAGGASVHYHYLSPTTAGLFRNGISFSGTAFDSWTQAEKSREKAFKLGELMNCTATNSQDLIACLRTVPAYTLVKGQEYFQPWHLNEFTPFGPVVEKNAKNPFIDRSPIEIIRSGDVHDLPWITTVVSEEGLYPVAEFATNKSAFVDLDKNWESIAPHLLQYKNTIPAKDHARVARQIRKHYFGDEAITQNNFRTLTHLVGDRVFVVDAEKAAKEQANVNKSPVWFYYYSYRGVNSLSHTLSNTTNNYGVSHADDVLIIVGNTLFSPLQGKDHEMSKILTKLWIDVANNRLPKWEPVDGRKEYLKYLHISSPDNIKVETNYNFGQKNLWNSIDFNENKISN